MLEVVKYIKKHGLESLSEKFAVHIKRHKDFDNLVLLKYNQLSTPINDITRECRGIILDEADDWRVVCYSFKRFANYGESWIDDIDWSDAKVFKKEDGSLCQLYYYDGEWRVASSGNADASGNVGDFGFSFKDLFWKTWKSLGYQLPSRTDCCYSFELCTKYNALVVQYSEDRLPLIGARQLTDLKELNPIIEAHINDWKCVEIFNFEDSDAILATLKGMNGSEQEGFVVCDINFNRCKLKCEDYCAKHRMVCSTTSRSILDVVRLNEGSEFICYAPQFKDQLYEIKAKYERVVGQIEGFYEAIKDIDGRKDFALKATTQKFSGALFAMKFSEKSVREYLAEMNIKTLEQWLDIKSAE